MDRTDFFLVLITYLLAAQIYLTADGNTTPTFIAFSTIVILFGIPIYLIAHVIAIVFNLPGEPIFK